jgi:hypothetical protein
MEKANPIICRPPRISSGRRKAGGQRVIVREGAEPVGWHSCAIACAELEEAIGWGRKNEFHKSQSLLALFIVPILVFSSRGQTAPQPNPEDMKRYWQPLVPSIPLVLKQAFPNERIEDNHPVRLVETADITGDGIPEAVVDLGEGGAYTDYVTVMRIEEGKAIVALFKEADGKVSGYFFQGASVRHGESVRMLPDKKAVYSMSTSTDDYGREDTCGVGAYQWDARRRVFVWNKLLSK